MTHLLVTGALGFIGSHIVEGALARGWRVTAVDSLRPDVHATTSVPAWFSSLTGEVDLVVGDAGGLAPDLLAGVDVVCHQAAKVGLGVSFGDAPDYVESNVGVTARLLSAMADAGNTRLVLASSMVVYGEGLYRADDAVMQPPERRIEDLQAGRFDPVGPAGQTLEPVLIGEDNAPDPRNVYALSKLAQEHLARSWARSTGGRVAALRYHNVFGARMPDGTPYAGVASLFRSGLAQGRAPRVFEDGAQRRDFVDVRDIASANLSAITWLEGQAPGWSRAFNVGSGTVHTIGEFAAALARAMKGPVPEITGEYRLGDVRHITASSERISSEMGWKAEHLWPSVIEDFAVAPARDRVS